MQEGDLREGDREGDEESVVTLRQPWRRRLYGEKEDGHACVCMRMSVIAMPGPRAGIGRGFVKIISNGSTPQVLFPQQKP